MEGIIRMKKALVVATVAGFIAGFEFNNVLILKEMGYEVHIAANMDFCNNTRNLKKLLLDGVIAHDF